ncbi:MAG: insulinase family protein [Oxalobacter sp.]|nr:MAG: insulinase family protein [Oxalobacter sp.]
MKIRRGLTRTACALLLTGATWVAQAAPIASWHLPNGARVLFVENHALPIVDASVSLDAGSRRDPNGQSGVAGMTCAMLRRGLEARGSIPAMDEAQISDAIADIAADIGCSADTDRVIISLRSLSSQAERDTTVALASRMLSSPAFPAALLEREKTRSIAAIREDDTRPASLANKAFWRSLYGTHPYGQVPTVETVARITQDDLRAHHRQYYVADSAVIAIVGDVSREEANVIALALTAGLPRTSAALPVLPKIDVNTFAGAQEVRQAHPASQAHILMGMPSLERGDPDYFAIIVGNYILGGGGFVSRLVHEVREKRGMAYSVRSGFSPMKQAGPFQISLQTKKEQSDEAIHVVRATLDNFLHKGPTQAELQAAKDNMIGGFALNIDTNSKMLANVSAIGYYDLPLDYLETWKRNVAKVTTHDIRAAFRRKLDPARLVTVIVGAPEKKNEAQADRQK